MTELKQIKEIEKQYGITRRMIQRYQKCGLIENCAKTKYGYLLYDQKNISRMLLIRFAQKLGFSLSEIRELMDAPTGRIIEAFQKKLPSLEKRIKEIESEIKITRRIIDQSLADPSGEALIAIISSFWKQD